MIKFKDLEKLKPNEWNKKALKLMIKRKNIINTNEITQQIRIKGKLEFLKTTNFKEMDQENKKIIKLFCETEMSIRLFQIWRNNKKIVPLNSTTLLNTQEKYDRINFLKETNKVYLNEIKIINKLLRKVK